MPGKMIMTIFASIAEFERDLIRKRAGPGRADAQMRGVRFGRPKKRNADQQTLAQRLLKEEKSVREVARTFGVHPDYYQTIPKVRAGELELIFLNEKEAPVVHCDLVFMTDWRLLLNETLGA